MKVSYRGEGSAHFRFYKGKKRKKSAKYCGFCFSLLPFPKERLTGRGGRMLAGSALVVSCLGAARDQGKKKERGKEDCFFP